jgi:hypothetical protein
VRIIVVTIGQCALEIGETTALIGQRVLFKEREREREREREKIEEGP